MKWRKRFSEWAVIYNGAAGEVPRWRLWIKMIRALMSGTIPRRVYIRRLRTCMKCPVYDPILRVCRPRNPAFSHLGCGCYIPFTALAAAPYPKGCWGRQHLPSVGWPAWEK